MALITCPECHALNISDTAEQCPKCGYAIKEHFIREKRRMEYQEREARQREKVYEEEQKLKPELEQKLAEIDELPYPQKPTFLKTLFYDEGGGSSLTFMLFGSLIITFLLSFSSSLFAFLCAVILVLGVPFFLFIVICDYKAAVRRYEIQTKNWDKYKEEIKDKIRSEYKDYARNLALYGSREAPMPQFNISTENKPKCPICGSTNIKEISTLSKVTSFAMVGLLSSKIGKQMKCENCGYKF